MSKPTKVFILIAVILAVGIAVFLKETKRSSPNKGSLDILPSPGELSSNPLPQLIDLGADKCIPCKMMAPILEELDREYEGIFEVEFIDVWKNPQAGKKFGVQMIPTQIFLDVTGKELYRHQGFLSKQDILARWEQLGVKLAN